jgi:hypothetical protein
MGGEKSRSFVVLPVLLTKVTLGANSFPSAKRAGIGFFSALHGLHSALSAAQKNASNRSAQKCRRHANFGT